MYIFEYIFPMVVTTNQHHMVRTCKLCLMLVTSNTGFFSREGSPKNEHFVNIYFIHPYAIPFFLLPNIKLDILRNISTFFNISSFVLWR